jgi:hypothetical protein
MNPLNLEATRSTPLIRFDREESTLLISGESYPENSFEFYAPVIAWVQVALTQLDRFRLTLSISYMNSSSVKCLLDLLDLLEEGRARGMTPEITWYYDPENPRALDLAEEFQEEVSLPFTITAVPAGS